MRLRAAVLREIIVDLAAENLVEEAALAEQLAVRRGVEPLDRGTEFDEALADVGVAVHRADRAVEEPVAVARRLQHFLAAHVGDLVDALAEFGRILVLRDEVVDEAVDALLELRFLFARQRDKARGLFGRDGGDGFGRRQRQCFGCGGRRGLFAHSCSFQPLCRQTIWHAVLCYSSTTPLGAARARARSTPRGSAAPYDRRGSGPAPCRRSRAGRASRRAGRRPRCSFARRRKAG